MTLPITATIAVFCLLLVFIAMLALMMFAIRNRHLAANKMYHATGEVVGPASYLTASKPTVTINDLRNIESIDDVWFTTQGVGAASEYYGARATSITQNIVTFVVIDMITGVETIDTTVLNTVTFVAHAIGSGKYS